MAEYVTVDLGKGGDGEETIGASMPESSGKKYYPSLYLNDVKLPDTGEKEFYAKVKLRKKSYTKDYEDDTVSCSYDVLEISVPKAGGETKSREKTIEESFDEAMAIVITTVE